MASYTTNLNLKKPAGSENVAIGDINNNMDTIDQAFGTLNSKIGVEDLGAVTDLDIPNTNLEQTKTYRFMFGNDAQNLPHSNDGGFGFLGFNRLSKNYGRMIVFIYNHISTRSLSPNGYSAWVDIV